LSKGCATTLAEFGRNFASVSIPIIFIIGRKTPTGSSDGHFALESAQPTTDRLAPGEERLSPNTTSDKTALSERDIYTKFITFRPAPGRVKTKCYKRNEVGFTKGLSTSYLDDRASMPTEAKARFEFGRLLREARWESSLPDRRHRPRL
jgi:hypothetical protein